MANTSVPEFEKKRRLEAAFNRLCSHAAEGSRCPENGTFEINSHTVGTLARMGRIRVLVGALNYRTVEILSGPQAGKSTKSDGSRVWKIVDRNGTKINGKLQVSGAAAPVSLAKINLPQLD